MDIQDPKLFGEFIKAEVERIRSKGEVLYDSVVTLRDDLEFASVYCSACNTVESRAYDLLHDHPYRKTKAAEVVAQARKEMEAFKAGLANALKSEKRQYLTLNQELKSLVETAIEIRQSDVVTKERRAVEELLARIAKVLNACERYAPQVLGLDTPAPVMALPNFTQGG